MRARQGSTLGAIALLLAVSLGAVAPATSSATSPDADGHGTTAALSPDAAPAVSSESEEAPTGQAPAGQAPSGPAPTGHHHDEGDVVGHTHFRGPTQAELDALGLVPGTGPCAGYYESFPRDQQSLADRDERASGASRPCTHGPDFLAEPEPAVTTGTTPGYTVYASEIDPTYRPPETIPCYGTGPYVHVFYGYTSGSANRLATLKPLILEAVGRVDDIYNRSAGQVGTIRHIRWKTSGTPCQLVVTAVAIPATTMNQTYPGPIRTYLQGHGFLPTNEKALFFGDEAGCPGGGIAGIAELQGDERDTSANLNNQGSMLARVFGCYWTHPTDVSYSGDLAAHEVTHTMGAVGDNAPNSSSRTGGRSHCTDGDDVMCYDDGGGEPRKICAVAYPSYLDCRKDDYFSPVPAPGSYIDTHWNTSDNQFLAKAAPAAVQALPHPDAAVTSPTGGTASGAITITATATAPSDGAAILQVEFWAGTDLVDIDDTAPYTTSFDTRFNGDPNNPQGYPNGTNLKIVAVAVDARGRFIPSPTRTVTIQNPTVHLTSPAPYSTSTGSVAWAAAATSGAGIAITKVELLDGGGVIDTDTTAPFGGTVTLAPGYTTIVARVTDANGTTRDSAGRLVTVVDPAPTVQLHWPATNTQPTVRANDAQTLWATAAAAPGRTVTKVEFSIDGGPYTAAAASNGAWKLDWTPTVGGFPAIAVRVTDSSNLTATDSSAVTVLDPPASDHPSVTLTSPTNGSTVGGTINLQATVTAPSADWVVQTVDFYLDGTYVGSDTTPASGVYAFAYKNVDFVGPTVFTAQVQMDNQVTVEYAQVDSRAVMATLNPPTLLAITSPTNGAKLKGDVSVVGSVADPTALNGDPELWLSDAFLDYLFGPSYTSTLYSARYENGTTTLRMAQSFYDGYFYSAPISVTFANAAIAQTAPTAGQTVTSKINLTASATGLYDVGIDRVRFYVDGIEVGHDSYGTYAVSWDPASVALGDHTTYADMVMTDGNVMKTAVRTFKTAKAPTVTRLAGTDRYATAVAISKASFPTVPVSAVYIATGASFPDALAGAPVAGRDGVPLLLVTQTSIPAVVATELSRLKPAKIVILGGTGAVSDAVKSALDAYTTGTVTRLAGTDRYATAVAISKASFSPGVPAVYVATGGSFPDALAGAPVAGRDGAPLLLVTPTAIPDVVKSELTRLNPGKIVILGGTGAVSDAVKAALDAYTAGTVSRLSGADRYATAVAISKASFGTPANVVYIATGAAFPDALAGAPVAGDRGAPLLLVTQSAIPSSVKTELTRLKPKSIVILGGTGAVSDTVKTALAAYLVP